VTDYADPRVFPLAEIYRLNSWLFHNCLEGLSDEQANLRLSDRTNNAAFTAAHVADARFSLLSWLGVTLENPLAEMLAEARSIDEVQRLPTPAQLREAWDAVSATLAQRLAALTTAELDAPGPQPFPAGGGTLLGALAFLAQHDSYHIGQLALFRKYAGLPAMKYTERR
jgi:uncharacterized damage-inducible protein DinB